MQRIVDTEIMEEHIESTYMVPFAEFVDYFDTFRDGIFPSHWHRGMEIHIILKGSAKFLVNGTTYMVREGSGLYIAPQSIHSMKKVDDGTISYNIVVDPQIFIFFLRNMQCTKYIMPLIKGLPDALLIERSSKKGIGVLSALDAIRAIGREEEAYELLIMEKLICLWRNLYLIVPHHQDNGQSRSKMLREKRMRVMVEFIRKHFYEQLSIQQIAEAANISKSECYRCFSLLSEMAPSEYLNKIRLLHAAQLLSDTNQNIIAICYQVGFNDTSYFAKMFKREYGLSPRSYRKKETIAHHQSTEPVMDERKYEG